MILSVSFMLVSVFAVISASGTPHNCRVMADCDNGLAWKSLSYGTEILSGPEIHHYSQTLTYAMGKSFCHRKGNNRLCRSDELCSNGEFLFDVIPGDNWVPVLDDYNEWLEIGDDSGRTCYIHGPQYGPPPWGITTVVRPYKGYVYCCPKDSSPTANYQYIGKTATYNSSKKHCTRQGMRLCSTAEVCKGNNPVFGTIVGDYWVAVNDKNNEWVEIGNSRGRTCWVHGDQYGPPDWGERTDGSAKDWLGYVYCCSD